MTKNGRVKLTFLGATVTVTGSRFLVREASSLLLDCGLFQGYKALRLRNWAPFPVEPKSVDAVVLSHAHLDHSGALPLLVKQGFKGKVFCTPATLDLARILLADCAHLQEEQAEHANRHGYSKHAPALPLYTREDAERALRSFEAVPFDTEWQPARGFKARLTRAGHILGAAIVTLRAGNRTLVFSGDLGRQHDAIMPGPGIAEHADALLLEATYGDRRHETADPVAALGRIVTRTAARGGVVLIPSFAVGRAQEVLFGLYRLKATGAIPKAMPIYVDSPMAADVTALYERYTGEHHLSRRAFRAMCKAATFVASPDESRALDDSRFPMVILSASGMATGGRVLHHLKRLAPDPRNTILFAGFQAGGTRGAVLVAGAPEVKIHGAYVPVRAEVRQLEALSAHADYGEILGWLAGFRERPGRIFLVHGEPGACDGLRRRIADRYRWSAEIPEYLQTVDLGVPAAR